MTEKTLEQRVAELEAIVQQLQQTSPNKGQVARLEGIANAQEGRLSAVEGYVRKATSQGAILARGPRG